MKLQQDCTIPNIQIKHKNVWREGDYREVVLYVAAARGGYYYRVTEGREVLHSTFIISHSDCPALELEKSAKEVGRRWARTYAPDAVVRTRSASERQRLFGDYVTGESYPNASRPEAARWAA